MNFSTSSYFFAKFIIIFISEMFLQLFLRIIYSYWNFIWIDRIGLIYFFSHWLVAVFFQLKTESNISVKIYKWEFNNFFHFPIVRGVFNVSIIQWWEYRLNVWVYSSIKLENSSITIQMYHNLDQGIWASK